MSGRQRTVTASRWFMPARSAYPRARHEERMVNHETIPESLTARFEALHAERLRTWDPAQLARNVETRRALVAAFDPARVIKVGDRVDAFELPLSSGGTLSLDDLVTSGPAILIFFRFAG